MEFHIIDMIYAALSICAQADKTIFSCKDDCTLTKHTGRWTYSARDFEIPLCHIPPLRSFCFMYLTFALNLFSIEFFLMDVSFQVKKNVILIESRVKMLKIASHPLLADSGYYFSKMK